jgi:hypothetical protein
LEWLDCFINDGSPSSLMAPTAYGASAGAGAVVFGWCWCWGCCLGAAAYGLRPAADGASGAGAAASSAAAATTSEEHDAWAAEIVRAAQQQDKDKTAAAVGERVSQFGCIVHVKPHGRLLLQRA